MQLNTLVLALVGMTIAVEGSTVGGRFRSHRSLVRRQNGFPPGTFGKGNPNNNPNNASDGKTSSATANGGTTLDPSVIQKASAQDGSPLKDGQSPSLTDDANFINFCKDKTLTNGLQNEAGSCNPIPMGDLPAKSKMASAIITSPVPGGEPAANTDFDVLVSIKNVELGTFCNPESQYYTAPQQLGKSGAVIGHTHITIQDIGSLTPTEAPDAAVFAFFKGINDAGDGNGHVKATVAKGLKAGTYRICTMTGASTHQAVLMPVAQRYVPPALYNSWYKV